MFQANATIVYLNKSSVLVGESPITGEPIFEDVSTAESISVSIEKDAVEPKLENLPGRDITRHFYSGRLVSPKTLPSWYKPGSTFEVEFTNGQQAKFYAYPTAPSRLGLDSYFGVPIEGVVLS